MNKILIIIPTYNEQENVRGIASVIFEVCPDVDILFVDDNSPDGTGRIIDDIAGSDSRIHVLHKPGKEGLGRAYISGFKWALERTYTFIFEMDADFSHDPRKIPTFIAAAENTDISK